MPTHFENLGQKTNNDQKRRINFLKKEKKVKSVMKGMNPFRKLMNIRRKAERTVAKRASKRFDTATPSELMGQAENRLSR